MARFLAEPKVARWLDRYPPDPLDRRDVRPGHPALDRARLVGARRRGRARQGRRRRRRGVGGVDRPAGRVEDGARARRLVRRQGAQRLVGLDPAERSSSSSVSSTGAGFVRCTRLDLLALLSFGVSLWFFNRGEVFRSAPLAVPPLAYLLVRTPWIGFRGPPRQPGAQSGPSGCLSAAAVFLGGFRIGLNLESPQRRDRRRLRRRDRRRQDPRRSGAVRAHAGRGRTARLRPGRRRRRDPRPDPAERPLRVGQPARRHVRPRRLPRLRALPSLALGWSGKWDSLPAAHATAIAFDLLVVLGLAARRAAVRRDAAGASRSHSAGSRFRSRPTR